MTSAKNFKVGQVWKNLDGQPVIISGIVNEGMYPIVGYNKVTGRSDCYCRYGMYNDSPNHPFNLIEMIEDAPGEPATIGGVRALDLLNAAAHHMAERAATYDQPQGERSMGKIVAMFNTMTGHNLSEVEGWHFMVILKLVRFHQNPSKPHRDSLEDAIAYNALAAEAALGEKS